MTFEFRDAASVPSGHPEDLDLPLEIVDVVLQRDVGRAAVVDMRGKAAVVTDAELAADELLAPHPLRTLCESGCKKCIERCDVRAFAEPAALEVEDVPVSFVRRDLVRCDGSKRYALVGSAGMKYLGDRTDVAPPDEIPAEALRDALDTYDPVFKRRPASLEWCAVVCPAFG